MIAFFPSRTIALQIGSFGVHWYGIMYLLAFLLAMPLLPLLQKYRKLSLTKDQWMTILTWVIVGVLVGGRLGYVLLYEPLYFAHRPWEVFAVWNGGMASHGGFVGVAAALFFVTRKMHISLARIADVVSVPAAIGLALGRVGNFINQELYGTITSLPWGITIPGVEGIRHPLQLYDASLSLLIAGICFVYLRSTPTQPRSAGRTFALLLILYSIMRFCLEFIREQQYPLVSLGVMSLTRGQVLTVPMFFIGLFLFFYYWDKADSAKSSV